MSAPSSAQYDVTEEDMRRMAEELADTASQRGFVAAIQEVQRAPAAEKVAVARSVARVEEVTARGVRVPPSFRLTTRTFENPGLPSIADSEPAMAPRVSFDRHSASVAHDGIVVNVTARQPVPDEVSHDTVRSEIETGIAEIGAFVASAHFQEVLHDLAALDARARPRFVVEELLDARARARRGLETPEGMHIQRSEFADGRPTLFCVTKVLPLAYPWHKVTVTFDNP